MSSCFGLPPDPAARLLATSSFDPVTADPQGDEETLPVVAAAPAATSISITGSAGIPGENGDDEGLGAAAAAAKWAAPCAAATTATAGPVLSCTTYNCYSSCPPVAEPVATEKPRTTATAPSTTGAAAEVKRGGMSGATQETAEGMGPIPLAPTRSRTKSYQNNLVTPVC